MPVAPSLTADQPWRLFSTRQRWSFLTILFLSNASSYFDRCVVSVLLEPIKAEFGVSDTLLGLLSGFSFALFYSVAAIPVSRIADHGNRRTLIAGSIGLWSLATCWCGLAQSFTQLIVARLAVGASEAGAVPVAQSLASDYFPPSKRAFSLACLNAAAAIGYLMGISVGGYLAATQGWRMAFFAAGIPGLLLAVVAQVFLREPRKSLEAPIRPRSRENLGASVRALAERRSYVWLVIGMCFYFVFTFASSNFLPSFMMRTLHASLEDVSLSWGLAVGGAVITGSLAGGVLADRLGREHPRRYAFMAAAAFSLAGLVYWAGLSTQSLPAFIAASFTAEFLLAAGAPAAYAAIHAVCGEARRATAIAIVLFAATLTGGSLGPLTVGLLSDTFASAGLADSLRPALIAICSVLVPCSLCFVLAGARMRSGAEWEA